MRVLAITTMRNEAPFILEWIAYHQHIGVTDFLIYSNDCDDGTDLQQPSPSIPSFWPRLPRHHVPF